MVYVLDPSHVNAKRVFCYMACRTSAYIFSIQKHGIYWMVRGDLDTFRLNVRRAGTSPLGLLLLLLDVRIDDPAPGNTIGAASLRVLHACLNSAVVELREGMVPRRSDRLSRHTRNTERAGGHNMRGCIGKREKSSWQYCNLANNSRQPQCCSCCSCCTLPLEVLSWFSQTYHMGGGTTWYGWLQ